MTATEVSREKYLNEEFKFYGICVNCESKDDCVYRQNPDKPILFCEQYEVPVTPSQNLSIKRQEQQTEPESNNFRGLCINCEKRSSCMFPKPEGGVWHCEEYV
jgi:hypothetical protein